MLTFSKCNPHFVKWTFFFLFFLFLANLTSCIHQSIYTSAKSNHSYIHLHLIRKRVLNGYAKYLKLNKLCVHFVWNVVWERCHFNAQVSRVSPCYHTPKCNESTYATHRILYSSTRLSHQHTFWNTNQKFIRLICKNLLHNFQPFSMFCVAMIAQCNHWF